MPLILIFIAIWSPWIIAGAIADDMSDGDRSQKDIDFMRRR